jgi:mRNA interferase RelE/StbE
VTAKRIRIQWTATAKDGLAKLPPKARRGLLEKARELEHSDDPGKAHKPLTGPLAGYFRLTYARYRAIYMVDEEVLPDNSTVAIVKVLFVACGIRKEGDRKDVYRLAKKMLKLGGFDGIDVVDDPESEAK